MELSKDQKRFYDSAEMEVIEAVHGDIICTSPGPASNEGFGDWEDI